MSPQPHLGCQSHPPLHAASPSQRPGRHPLLLRHPGVRSRDPAPRSIPAHPATPSTPAPERTRPFLSAPHPPSFLVSRFGVPRRSVLSLPKGPNRTTSRRPRRPCPEPVERGTQRQPLLRAHQCHPDLRPILSPPSVRFATRPEPSVPPSSRRHRPGSSSTQHPHAHPSQPWQPTHTNCSQPPPPTLPPMRSSRFPSASHFSPL